MRFQIDIFKIIRYAPYVIAGIIVFLLINSSVFLYNKNKDLEEKANKLDLKAKEYISKYNDLKSKDSVLALRYDSLSRVRSNIKIKYNERIKIIDRYTVSDMQYFFNERTGEGCNPR